MVVLIAYSVERLEMKLEPFLPVRVVPYLRELWLGRLGWGVPDSRLGCGTKRERKTGLFDQIAGRSPTLVVLRA